MIPAYITIIPFATLISRYLRRIFPSLLSLPTSHSFSLRLQLSSYLCHLPHHTPPPGGGGRPYPSIDRPSGSIDSAILQALRRRSHMGYMHECPSFGDGGGGASPFPIPHSPNTHIFPCLNLLVTFRRWYKSRVISGLISIGP